LRCPVEVAFHPTDEAATNEIYLLCDDLAEEMQRLEAKGVAFTQVDEERWGTVTASLARRHDDRSLSTQAPHGAHATDVLKATARGRRLGRARRHSSTQERRRRQSGQGEESDHQLRGVSERGDRVRHVEPSEDRDQTSDAEHRTDLARHVEHAAAGAEARRGIDAVRHRSATES